MIGPLLNDNFSLKVVVVVGWIWLLKIIWLGWGTWVCWHEEFWVGWVGWLCCWFVAAGTTGSIAVIWLCWAPLISVAWVGWFACVCSVVVVPSCVTIGVGCCFGGDAWGQVFLLCPSALQMAHLLRVPPCLTYVSSFLNSHDSNLRFFFVLPGITLLAEGNTSV